jgi:hypothetical protein
MRKFTKSLLTLMLLMLAVGGAKAYERSIYTRDYSTVADRDGAGFWEQVPEGATVKVKDGLLVINNTKVQEQMYSLQVQIGSGFTTEAGHNYKVKIDYKTTAAGGVWVGFGGWNGKSVTDYGVNLSVADDFQTYTWNISKFAYSADDNFVIFQCGSLISTIYIKKVEVLEVGPDVAYISEVEKYEAPAGTTDINGMTGEGDIKWDVTYPKELAPQTGWCGDIDSNGNAVSLEGYDYLHFVVTNVQAGKKLSLRVFVWDGTARQCLYPHPIDDVAEVSDWKAIYYISEPGTYVVDISNYPLLRGFKAGNGFNGDESNGTIIVSQAYVSSEDPVDYIPTGKTTISGTEFLSYKNITCFDATGLIKAGQTLDATNPNALFIAKEGILTNANNVIIDGVCDKLVLTDGDYPFKAPADFTATTATYTRDLGSAGAGTLCLPFAAAIPDGVTAYTLEYSSGDKAAATLVNTTIPANTPVLLNGSGEKTFSGSGDVSASATNVVGSLTGVFASESVPTNSYVLQKQGDNVGFYKVNTDITIPPFRAYLTADADARGFIGIDEMSPTGVNEVKVNKVVAKTGKIYNLNGQIVSKPTKGLYIVDGKVVSF